MITWPCRQERGKRFLKKPKEISSEHSSNRKKLCQETQFYKLGSVVLKKDFSKKKRKGGKLDEKWLGPFTIVVILGQGLYHLQAVDATDIIPRVNGVHLKPYNINCMQLI